MATDLLVVDASVAVSACLARDGFRRFRKHRLVAPRLMWSEALSALHELTSRQEVSALAGASALDQLLEAPIGARQPAQLGREAWRVADALGWVKTYDAEYVALARLLRCALVTLDARLQRRAGDLIEIAGPAEI